MQTRTLHLLRAGVLCAVAVRLGALATAFYVNGASPSGENGDMAKAD
ncbi:MAG: hypothetical protein ACRBBU_01805 [Pseudooceanicola sp.]